LFFFDIIIDKFLFTLLGFSAKGFQNSLRKRERCTFFFERKKYQKIGDLLPTRLSCLCPYGAQERACVMRTDTHRANQIDKISAAAEFPSPLLSDTGAISRNALHLRKKIALA